MGGGAGVLGRGTGGLVREARGLGRGLEAGDLRPCEAGTLEGDGTDFWSFTHLDGWTDKNSPVFYRTLFHLGPLPKRSPYGLIPLIVLPW